MSAIVKSRYVVGVTGASRCGKTTFAEAVKKMHNGRFPVVIISQDRFFKEHGQMPKRTLQYAPFIKIGYWDDAVCVDWKAMITAVKKAFNDAAPDTLFIVEGNMIVECDELCALVDQLCFMPVDKWLCFKRRSESDSRQHYLPYMEALWESHLKRFERQRQGTRLLMPNDDLMDLLQTCTSAVAVHNALVARTGVVGLIRDDNQPCPDDLLGHKRMKSALGGEHFYGERLAQLIAGLSSPDEVKRVQKVYTVLLGASLGDALGAPYEFGRGKPVVCRAALDTALVMSGRSGVRGAPPGAITDDSQMRDIILMIVGKHGVKIDDVHSIRTFKTALTRAYIDWSSDHPGGIGENTRALFQHDKTKNRDLPFQKYEKEFELRHAANAKKKESNGTLMRANAFAVFKDRAVAIKAARIDAEISNCNPINIGANELYVALLWDLVNEKHNVNALQQWFDKEYVESALSITDAAARDRIISVALHATENEDATVHHIATGDISQDVNSEKKGWVLCGLWMGLRHLMRSASLERSRALDQLVKVVNAGGDTDTNAAIAGALIAATMSPLDLVAGNRFNLDVMLNVPYAFSTIKVLDYLRPHQIGDKLAKIVALQQSNKRSISAANDDDDNDDGERTNVKRGATQTQE